MKAFNRYAATVFFLLTVHCFAQQREHMIPAGFNNPFLKSGQYITSLYYNATASKSDSKEDMSGTETNRYSIYFMSYLGLTDQLTLSLGLFTHPQQTYNTGLYGSGGDIKNSFYINPQMVLSFRPADNMEIFGLFTYSNYSLSFTESSYMTNVPVVGSGGIVTWEEQRVIAPARPDISTLSTTVKFGVTYSGSLW